jgi:hypothetical protein
MHTKKDFIKNINPIKLNRIKAQGTPFFLQKKIHLTIAPNNPTIWLSGI